MERIENTTETLEKVSTLERIERCKKDEMEYTERVMGELKDFHKEMKELVQAHFPNEINAFVNIPEYQALINSSVPVEAVGEFSPDLLKTIRYQINLLLDRAYGKYVDTAD